MAAQSPRVRFVRFGVFEVDLEERELCKKGRKVKLQDQPFEVLIALLENPGRTVTIRQLSRRIWPDGTFVDFDQSLYTAIARIRSALNDSSENCRFVETIPRHGYRFIGPVEFVRSARRQEQFREWLSAPSGER